MTWEMIKKKVIKKKKCSVIFSTLNIPQNYNPSLLNQKHNQSVVLCCVWCRVCSLTRYRCSCGECWLARGFLEWFYVYLKKLRTRLHSPQQTSNNPILPPSSSSSSSSPREGWVERNVVWLEVSFIFLFFSSGFCWIEFNPQMKERKKKKYKVMSDSRTRLHSPQPAFAL